jgi:DNA-binding LytR/AlgR family response regulator
MNILIVEDEQIATDRLIRLLQNIDPDIKIVGQVDSIKSTVKWLAAHPTPDLAFFDIQLADGISFKVFEQTEVTCPIIFTTAYDQYAIQAFKVNSIDYLLKPLVEKDLEGALLKFESTKNKPAIDASQLLQLLGQKESVKYKERFVIKVGDHLKSVLTQEVELFYSQDRTTYLLSKSNQKYILDYTLDQIEELINPGSFFRISRKYIVHIDNIADIISYSNSRLKLSLTNYQSDDLVISRERVSEFKKWLDR